MSREVIIAEHAGFCFGVKRAVDIAVNCKGTEGANTYTLGPLIHNDDVINRLKGQNINQIGAEDLSGLSPEDTVVIRSHGVTPDVKSMIEQKGAKVIDATCPYVSSIQNKAKKYYEMGYQIIIVGDKNHPEVIGINGWCDNTAIVTKDGSDLGCLPDKVCIVSQTTERLSNYERAVDIVKKKCRDVVTFNTICSATRERQNSADEVSKKVDLMIVIGGKNSSNSKKLYDICSMNCKNTLFIENSAELPQWVFDNKDIRKIGITAGASAPEWIINDVIDKVKDDN